MYYGKDPKETLHIIETSILQSTNYKQTNMTINYYSMVFNTNRIQLTALTASSIFLQSTRRTYLVSKVECSKSFF